jgi:hypothetical protein
MPISIILDVATGLVFLYFLLALIASSIQELIAGLFAWRGTYLSKGIGVILDNQPEARFIWHGIGDFLQAHFTSGTGQTALDRLNGRLQQMPAAQVTPGDKLLQKILSIQGHPLLKGNPSTLPAYVPARNFALALLDILRDGSQSTNFAQIKATIGTLPDGDLKTVLSAFLADAGNDVDKFRASLERWFDDAMDRLSGIYNRLSHYMMLILGVLFAIFLNINSIHVATALWETPSIRAATIASASNATTIIPDSKAPPTPNAVPQLSAAWNALQGLEGNQLPFGWKFSQGKDDTSTFLGRNVTVSTPFGWIITAAAIAFGAPFWFGLLQNLANMRSSGPPPKPTTP